MLTFFHRQPNVVVFEQMQGRDLSSLSSDLQATSSREQVIHLDTASVAGITNVINKSNS